MSFLNKLEKLMSDKGIENLSRLSRETGIPYTTIDGFYKKGTENIKLSTLKKLANYFDCSLDFLVDDNITEDTDNEIHTIAAHHDGEDWTEEELEDIENFKKYVLSKRNKK
ncbi:helix-turn-helix transcriptional regulator [Sedimentibacter sp.]|uniref:helix-turn-helix domain-containing protein n=1 Tax=Sedimentibacter sp. TaxID=1960295 RepID=UPI0028AA316F|nr:helix-turn-helix transcriptional regulator [Sedimentibacter sp.]